MKIEFTVEDYFNELQSMEKYYGQEEDCLLYTSDAADE